MIPHRTIACLLLCSLGRVLGAQGQVVPAALGAVPAGSFTTYPLGVAGAMRMQTLYHGSELGFTTPRAIGSLELRADELRVQVGKAGIQLQIELSTTPTTGATLDPDFARNRGANHVVAFARRSVTVMATPYAFPGQFLGPFVLDAPFLFDPQAGQLLIEYDVAAQPAGALYLDTPAAFASGAHRVFGSGCGLYAPTSGGGLGHLLGVNVFGGTPAGTALLGLGVSALAVPVPIPGAPGCDAYLLPDLIVPTAFDQTGSAQVTVPVPADPTLRGASLWAQCFAVSAALALQSSNGSEVVLGDRHEVHRVYSLGSNTAALGLVQNHVAPVVRLR